MIRLDSHAPAYDDRHYLRLRGIGEIGDGEVLKVSLGESVLCGRSRHCHWSLKRTPAFLKDEVGGRERLRDAIGWRTTSRRHCRITYLAPDQVEVENLSANGTLVDGHLVDRIALLDCRRVPHRIQLGPHGPVLELGPGSLPIDVPARQVEEESSAG